MSLSLRRSSLRTRLSPYPASESVRRLCRQRVLADGADAFVDLMGERRHRGRGVEVLPTGLRQSGQPRRGLWSWAFGFGRRIHAATAVAEARALSKARFALNTSQAKPLPRRRGIIRFHPLRPARLRHELRPGVERRRPGSGSVIQRGGVSFATPGTLFRLAELLDKPRESLKAIIRC
jgi:hypothetical protein